MIIFKTDLEEIPPCCELCPYSRPYGFVGDRFCKVTEVYFTGNVKPPYKERPDECPLKSSPEKDNENYIFEYSVGYQKGWNDCIDYLIDK